MPNYFDFEPYQYQPRFAGGSDASTSIGQNESTEGSNSGTRSGRLLTINRDLRVAYDLVPNRSELNSESGVTSTYLDTFLCFPGDGTAQGMVLSMSFAGIIDERGRAQNSPNPIPYKLPNGTAFVVRVVQRDPATREETVIYPNTRYTIITGKPEIVEPVSPIDSMKPMFLVLVSSYPLFTGGVPQPGWSGDGAAPLTPVEYSSLRLMMTMQLLTSQVA